MDNGKPTYQELFDELEALKKRYRQEIDEKNSQIQALQNKLFKSDLALDALPVGAVVYDKEGFVYRYNKYFTKLFG
jgi:PAS domain-containing protein